MLLMTKKRARSRKGGRRRSEMDLYRKRVMYFFVSVHAYFIAIKEGDETTMNNTTTSKD